MSLAIVTSALALIVITIAAMRRDWRGFFFGCVIAGAALGSWIFHLTRISGMFVAPPVILLLYLTPLRRIRLLAGVGGGIALGVLLGELWAMLWPLMH